MLTSIEIAKLLQHQKKKKQVKQSFDAALIGLGAKLKTTSQQLKAIK